VKRYTLHLKLTVLGPFLTAATSSEVYGLDKAFYRNARGKVVVPGSHAKGKLRMALHELNILNAVDPPIDLETLFGQPSAVGSYEPARALVQFSNFTCNAPHTERTRVRTAINATTMTADENMLREFEDLFPSGSSTEWHGEATYFASDVEDALRIAKIIRLGFKWLTTLGAEKGIGSGRLLEVSVSQPKLDQTNVTLDLASSAAGEALQLRIHPKERLMIGGVKKPRANYVRSKQIIPGGVIKGALATSLNLAFGIKANVPLSTETGAQMPGFDLLAANYDKIRVSHAFPAIKDEKRPVKVPLSTVKIDDTDFYDMALSRDPSQLINKQAPVYSIDWKKPMEFFAMASPKEVFVTRTAIDDISRRSLEGQLFTYTFLCAEDDKNRPVDWVCNVDCSAIKDEQVRQSVRDQFASAVSSYLCNLGKLNQPVTVELLPQAATPAVDSYDLIYDDLAVVSLQTDTLMLDPHAVSELAAGEDLYRLYSDYWQKASNPDGQAPCLELVDFFASQNFQGGYLYHRYRGAGNGTQKQGQYYPYYLTGAGSVFVLSVTDPERARACLGKWLKSGLDLPGWADKSYALDGYALWQSCPFVPENGYGEIAVNLKWHWEKRPDQPSVNNIPAGGDA
jgi:CRISPR/Cas system CSM-associated protein Csm3 (group 7 of RAMP superfamily)